MNINMSPTMKIPILKYIILTAWIFMCLGFFQCSAIFGEDLWMDLYKEIDSWVEDYLDSSYDVRLNGNKTSGNLGYKVNTALELYDFGDCKISSDLSQLEFEEITLWNIELLETKLSPECFSFNWLDISTVNDIIAATIEIKLNAIEEAEESLEKNHQLTNVWIYSDWNLDNSTFDIISDLEEINDIIVKDSIKYESSTPVNSESLKNHFFSDDNYVNASNNKGTSNDGTISENELTAYQWNTWHEPTIWDVKSYVEPIDEYYFSGDQTLYMCAQDTNQSGLDPNELWHLLSYSLIPWSGKQWIPTSSYVAETASWWIAIQNPSVSEILSWTWSSLEKWNSNDIWWCKGMFCIDIEFTTYQNTPEWNSIQSIMENANNHIKKFINGSFVQWKMTTNNFENALRDVDLSDMLSLGIVVSSKVPPFLEIENEKESTQAETWNTDQWWEKSEASVIRQELFCKYWKAKWYDCERENDLSIFQDQEWEQISIENSWDLTLSILTQRIDERKLYLSKNEPALDIIQLANARTSQIDETANIEQQFSQLEWFVGSLLDHANQYNAAVKKMLKIPIHP